MKQDREFRDYDREIIDIDELAAMNIKINPDFYIHKALVKAQDALSNDDLTIGHILYRQYIEHIEILAKSAGMTDDDYIKDLEEYKQSAEYKKTEASAQLMKLANKKLYLIMERVFTQKTSTEALKA